MKYLFLLLSFITWSSVFSQKQISDSSINCLARWQKGGKKILLIDRSKKKYELQKLKSESNFSYEAHITILDSTATGYKIQWIFHLSENENQFLGNSLPGFEGMKMIYTTSKTGAFDELLNWQEVKDSYVKMMELSLPKNLDSAGKAAVDKSINLFNSKEMVEASLIKEIQLFHIPNGDTFTTAEIKNYGYLSNPFSENDPLPAVLTSKITEISPQREYFILKMDEQIEKEGAVKIFDAIFKKFNLENDTELKEFKKQLSSFETTKYSEYQFMQPSGWLKKLNHKMIVTIDQTTQIDSYTMKLKE